MERLGGFQLAQGEIPLQRVGEPMLLRVVAAHFGAEDEAESR